MAYRLDWFDDEGMVHEGPEATETELRSLHEGIFDSPDSWDSFNTATDTPDTTAADTSGTAGTKPGHETGHGPQIVFTTLAGGHGMPERWNCCPTTPPDRSRTSSTPEEPVEDGRNGQPDKTGNDAARTSTDCWTYCPSPWSRKTETTR